MNWFVSVHNQIYGPYSEMDMQGFVSEGRINSQSLISNAPAHGFFEAIGYDIFQLWAGSGQISVMNGYQAANPLQQSPASNRHTQSPDYLQNLDIVAQQNEHSVIPEAPENPVQVAGDNAEAHIFVVMAEIRSEGAVEFLRALQKFGPAQRVGDSVWLLRSEFGAEQIRNKLSQTLSRQDRLFILDSSSNTPAWFNIGADLDNRIRELFDRDHE